MLYTNNKNVTFTENCVLSTFLFALHKCILLILLKCALI